MHRSLQKYAVKTSLMEALPPENPNLTLLTEASRSYTYLQRALLHSVSVCVV